MSIFGKKTAFEDLHFRLVVLSEEVASLKSANKHIQLEWEELYDKVRHQMSRMSRRVTADAKANGDTPPLEPAVEPDDGLDPISRKILARRGNRRQAE